MPVQNRKRQIIFAAFSILTLFFLDQYSKALLTSKMSMGESIPVLRNILHITYIGNTGVAFGLFKNSSSLFIAISITAVIFILGLILGSINEGRFLSRPFFDTGLILIASGALGNLADRLRCGYVIDFIDVRIWPVFNLADSFITIGTLFLLFIFTFHRHP